MNHFFLGILKVEMLNCVLSFERGPTSQNKELSKMNLGGGMVFNKNLSCIFTYGDPKEKIPLGDEGFDLAVVWRESYH